MAAGLVRTSMDKSPLNVISVVIWVAVQASQSYRGDEKILKKR